MLQLLALSLAPSVFLMYYIYLKDKYEKEPISKILKFFFFGVVSVFVTLIISWIMKPFKINFLENTVFGQAQNAFLGVALVEEFSKFIFLRLALKDKEFDEPYDGIVYAVAISLGFASLENVLYVFEGGTQTAITRMFTAVPAHCSFGVLMGYFAGLHKFSKNKSLLLFGLLAATVSHGFYDFFLFIDWIPGIASGALLSLVLSINLSIKAIKLHQIASPFKERI